MSEEMKTTPTQQPENKNMMSCKACGASIAKKAKTCPACGAKNKKPIYKKAWFYVIILVVIIIIAVTAGGKSDDAEKNDSGKNGTVTTAVKEYTQVSIEKLLDDLKNNAYNAKQTWDNANLEITGGKVLTIDASGNYFSIESKDDEYFLDSIHVDVPSDIRPEVMSAIGDGKTVVVKGTITDVGEVFGYTLRADEVVVL